MLLFVITANVCCTSVEGNECNYWIRDLSTHIIYSRRVVDYCLEGFFFQCQMCKDFGGVIIFSSNFLLFLIFRFSSRTEKSMCYCLFGKKSNFLGM